MINNALCQQCFSDGPLNRLAKRDVNVENSNGLSRQKPKWHISQSGVIVILIVGFALFQLLAPKPTRDLSALTLKTPSGSYVSDPCRGKNRCLIAYVAPWCSACHNSVGFINQVGARVGARRDAGFKVVVGGDAAQSCTEFAAALKATTFIDPDSELQRLAGFSSVPHWVLLDEKQVMIDSFAGAYGSGVPPEQLGPVLREHFGSEVDNLL